jgi:hypothetical protein
VSLANAIGHGGALSSLSAPLTPCAPRDPPIRHCDASPLAWATRKARSSNEIPLFDG